MLGAIVRRGVMVVRRLPIEMGPWSWMVSAEPRLQLRDLVELLRRQLCLERIDRFQQRLGALAAGDRVVGETFDESKGLWLSIAASRLPRRSWALHHALKGVGEVAPGVELIGADADLGLHRVQPLGDHVGVTPPPMMMHAAWAEAAGRVAAPHAAMASRALHPGIEAVAVLGSIAAGYRPGRFRQLGAARLAPGSGEQG